MTHVAGCGWRFASVAALILAIAMLLLACGEESQMPTPTSSGPAPEPTATSTAASDPTTTPSGGEATPTPGDTTPTPPAPTATASGAQTPAPQTGGDIEHPGGKHATILRVTSEGGFAPPGPLDFRLPVFMLDGRGCVIGGAARSLMRQPTAPELTETCLTEEGVQLVLAAARDAGLLDGDAHYPMPYIADATTVIFEVNAGGVSSHVSVVALLEGAEQDITGSDAERQKAARRKLKEFHALVSDPWSWLPPEAVASPEGPYAIDRMQFAFLPAGSALTPMDAPKPDSAPVYDWPLDGDLADFGQPYLGSHYRCGEVAGADLETILALAPVASQMTLWTSDGNDDAAWLLLAQPLLGGQTACAEPFLRADRAGSLRETTNAQRGDRGPSKALIP